MSTYSDNTTIKIAGAIYVVGNSGSAYVVPANSYLELYVPTGVTNVKYNLPGNPQVSIAAGSTVKVPAGATISTSGAGGSDCYGVLFSNTP